MTGQRAFTGNYVVLPGADQPTAATIVVDTQTGKIIDVQSGRRAAHELPDVELIDAGDRVILPGLVE